MGDSLYFGGAETRFRPITLFWGAGNGGFWSSLVIFLRAAASRRDLIELDWAASRSEAAVPILDLSTENLSKSSQYFDYFLRMKIIIL